ncbi:unnamed protein product [Cylindrotheca closterium]|uniref:FAS1 domain-containing protein n=1 Tax=Cylindrotheca closterium TaxID=2856 RepID=A0AAD2CKE2_9STRA|nr:unnamed protein product [Cylindrotheca closterium]
MKIFTSIFLLLSTVVPSVLSQSIIDLAAADGKYGTLLNAVTNTPGVLDAIARSFPVTIFAPTNDAFAAIASTVSQLETSALATVLAGHVVQGVFTAQDFIHMGCVELTTLAGDHLRVLYQDGSVLVNESRVIQPNVAGDGGIIHGIDKVILPGTFRRCPRKKGGKRSGSSSSGSSGSKSGKRRLMQQHE